MIIIKDFKNCVAWQMDSQEKLFRKRNRNLDKILKMIFDMRTIDINDQSQALNVEK